MRICILTQNAFADFFGAQDFSSTIDALGQLEIDSIAIVRGIKNDESRFSAERPTDTVLPRIICECNRASIKEFETGNWNCSARIILETYRPDTTHGDNYILAAAVANLVESNTLHTSLSELEGYTAHTVRLQNCGYELEGEVWKNYWDIEVDCCASNVS